MAGPHNFDTLSNGNFFIDTYSVALISSVNSNFYVKIEYGNQEHVNMILYKDGSLLVGANSKITIYQNWKMGKIEVKELKKKHE